MCIFIGGAFYTPETIDTARLHYRSSWAPVLHAVALWLNSNGFEVNDNQEDLSSTPSKVPNALQGSSSSGKMLEDLVKDRMHLMLGKKSLPAVFFCFSHSA